MPFALNAKTAALNKKKGASRRRQTKLRQPANGWPFNLAQAGEWGDEADEKMAAAAAVLSLGETKTGI